VACHLLPTLEQGEAADSHYLSFVAMLQRYGRNQVYDRLPDEFKEPTRRFYRQIGSLLPHIAEPLLSHRITQAMTFSVHAAADRERARTSGQEVLPFAVHVSDLIDGLVGFLQAPVSPDTATALKDIEPALKTWSLVL
jgi:hypothetical protein